MLALVPKLEMLRKYHFQADHFSQTVKEVALISSNGV